MLPADQASHEIERKRVLSKDFPGQGGPLSRKEGCLWHCRSSFQNDCGRRDENEELGSRIRKMERLRGIPGSQDYVRIGQYDYVVVVDYPNEVAALKGSGCATALGVVQVQTLPACPIEDFIKVMGELPR